MKIIKIYDKIGKIALKKSNNYDLVVIDKDGEEYIAKDFKINTKNKKGIIYLDNK